MSTKKSLPRQVFKAYDIRGLHETQLTPEFVSLFAKNLVFWAQKHDHFSSAKVAVGYDMRPSSLPLEKALIDSLCEAGAHVYRFGCVSTPAFYHGVGAVEADLGVMISASHNGPEYNGLKVTLANAIPVSGVSGLQEIADLMEIDAASALPVATQRSITEVEIAFAASQAAFEALPPAPIAPFHIVCDSANGMGAQFLDHLATLCPELKLDRLFWELDGSFPNHPADPLDEENLHAMKARIRETGADLGIATDGDGDRVFFLDETGEVVPPAIVRGLLAQFVLRRAPESVICYDVRPGKITEDLILEAGGKPHLTRVGHSLIKDEMRRVDAAFGGESSGHFFYRLDNGIYESPIVAIVDMLRELTRRGTSFSQMIKPYKRYVHSGERNFRVEDTQVAIGKIAALFPDMAHSTLDGLSCAGSDVWLNVRASNTEPLLRVNIEGKTTEGVSATLSAITDVLIS